MKIKALAIIFAFVLCVVSCFALSPVGAAVQSTPKVAAINLQNPVKTASEEVLEARFLNMLNHNFVYGEDFKYIDEIINLSVIALLDRADTADSEFIKEDIVFSHISDMYGIDVVDASELNADFPKKDGFIYIIPRGYTVYKHTAPQITHNEDGSFTVTTSVTVNGHDTDEESYTAVSLFVKNSASAFGYNLISSEILETAVQM